MHVLALVVLRAFLAVVALGAGLSSASAKTLRVAIPSAPPSIGNPLASTATSPNYAWTAIFDGLTLISNDGQVQPWLVASWDIPTATTWRFRLRDDVTFSNGRKLNAAAVVQLFDYLSSDEAAAESISREIRTVKDVTAIGSFEFEIETTQPDPNLARSLASVKVPDMDHWAAVGRDGFAQDPIGTGPFRVEEWGAAEISLESRLDSWRPTQVDKLDLLVIVDAAARLQSFLAGRVDIAMQLSPDDIPTVESAGGSIFIRPLYGIIGITFQTVRETMFQDVRVRRAMNLAVNRQAIIDGLLAGKAELASQPTPRAAFGFNPELSPYPYNPDQARQLLAEAGYPNGFEFTMEATVGTGPNDAAIYQQVANDLAKIGVKMRIRTLTFPELTSRVRDGSWRGEALGMDYATAPSLNGLRPFQLHSCDWAGNWFCDETIMPTIRQARMELDGDKRLALTRDVIAFHRDQAQSLFLYDQIAFDGLSNRVRNYAPRTILPNYDTIELVEP